MDNEDGSRGTTRDDDLRAGTWAAEPPCPTVEERTAGETGEGAMKAPFAAGKTQPGEPPFDLMRQEALVWDEPRVASAFSPNRTWGQDPYLAPLAGTSRPDSAPRSRAGLGVVASIFATGAVFGMAIGAVIVLTRDRSKEDSEPAPLVDDLPAASAGVMPDPPSLVASAVPPTSTPVVPDPSAGPVAPRLGDAPIATAPSPRRDASDRPGPVPTAPTASPVPARSATPPPPATSRSPSPTPTSSTAPRPNPTAPRRARPRGLEI